MNIVISTNFTPLSSVYENQDYHFNKNPHRHQIWKRQQTNVVLKLWTLIKTSESWLLSHCKLLFLPIANHFSLLKPKITFNPSKLLAICRTVIKICDNNLILELYTHNRLAQVWNMSKSSPITSTSYDGFQHFGFQVSG